MDDFSSYFSDFRHYLAGNGFWSRNPKVDYNSESAGSGRCNIQYGYNSRQSKVILGLEAKYGNILSYDDVMRVTSTGCHELTHYNDHIKLLDGESSVLYQRIALSFLSDFNNPGYYNLGYNNNVAEIHANMESLQQARDFYADYFDDADERLISVWKDKSLDDRTDFFKNVDELDFYLDVSKNNFADEASVVNQLKKNMGRHLQDVLNNTVKPVPCRKTDIVAGYLMNAASDELVDCWVNAKSSYDRDRIAAAVNIELNSNLNGYSAAMDKIDWTINGLNIREDIRNNMNQLSRDRMRTYTDILSDRDKLVLLRDDFNAHKGVLVNSDRKVRFTYDSEDGLSLRSSFVDDKGNSFCSKYFLTVNKMKGFSLSWVGLNESGRLREKEYGNVYSKTLDDDMIQLCAEGIVSGRLLVEEGSLSRDSKDIYSEMSVSWDEFDRKLALFAKRFNGFDNVYGKDISLVETSDINFGENLSSSGLCF